MNVENRILLYTSEISPLIFEKYRRRLMIENISTIVIVSSAFVTAAAIIVKSIITYTH